MNYNRQTFDSTTEVVKQLTQLISQILDSANHLTDINMGSAAGRQIVAGEVARQLIDSPSTMVVDPTSCTEGERRAIDAALMPDSEHVYDDDMVEGQENTSKDSQDLDAALMEEHEVFPLTSSADYGTV